MQIVIPYESGDCLFEALQLARVMARCEGLADLEEQIQEAMGVIRAAQDRSRAASDSAEGTEETEAAR